MEWIQVESSQIACLGYEPEAEYPLGVMFKPSKKQAAAGQRGSVYEYANVSPQLFAEFLGAKHDALYDFSVGKFFEQRIKTRPDLFPFRKTETAVDLGPVTSATDVM
jgi:hypothetical protein